MSPRNTTTKKSPPPKKLLAPPPPMPLRSDAKPVDHHVRSAFLSIIGSVLVVIFVGIGLDSFGAPLAVILPILAVLLIGGIIFFYQILKDH